MLWAAARGTSKDGEDIDTYTQQLKVMRPSMKDHDPLCTPAVMLSHKVCKGSSVATSWRNSSKMVKWGAVNAKATTGNSLSRQERASATTLLLPGLYSTPKSYPGSLLTQ